MDSDTKATLEEAPCPIDYVALCEIVNRRIGPELDDDYRALNGALGQVVRLNALANVRGQEIARLKTEAQIDAKIRTSDAGLIAKLRRLLEHTAWCADCEESREKCPVYVEIRDAE